MAFAEFVHSDDNIEALWLAVGGERPWLDALHPVFVVVPYTKNNHSFGMSRIADYVLSDDGVTNSFWLWS
ncbi:hypothetical protein D9M68_872510 [compost metagenome]